MQAGTESLGSVFCTIRPRDVKMNEFLIQQQGNEELDFEEQALIRERNLERLRKMTFYCFTNECLREYILRYFGEYGGNYCGNCKNCLTEFEDLDVTEETRSILELVRSTGERYGSWLSATEFTELTRRKCGSSRWNQIPITGN